MNERKWILTKDEMPKLYDSYGTVQESDLTFVTIAPEYGAPYVTIANLESVVMKEKRIKRWRDIRSGRIVRDEVTAWMPLDGPKPYREEHEGGTIR